MHLKLLPKCRILKRLLRGGNKHYFMFHLDYVRSQTGIESFDISSLN